MSEEIEVNTADKMEDEDSNDSIFDEVKHNPIDYVLVPIHPHTYESNLNKNETTIIVERGSGKHYRVVDPVISRKYAKLNPFFQQFYRSLDGKFSTDTSNVIKSCERKLNAKLHYWKENPKFNRICSDINELIPKITEDEITKMRHSNLSIDELPQLSDDKVQFIKACIEDITSSKDNYLHMRLSHENQTRLASILNEIEISKKFEKFIKKADYHIVIKTPECDMYQCASTLCFEEIYQICVQENPLTNNILFSNVHFSDFKFKFCRSFYQDLGRQPLHEEIDALKQQIDEKQHVFDGFRFNPDLHRKPELDIAAVEKEYEQIRKELDTLKKKLRNKEHQLSYILNNYDQFVENLFIRELSVFQDFARIKHQQSATNIHSVFQVNSTPMVVRIKYLKNHLKKLRNLNPHILKRFRELFNNHFMVSKDQSTVNVDNWIKNLGIEIPDVFIDPLTKKWISKPVYFLDRYLESSTAKKILKQFKDFRIRNIDSLETRSLIEGMYKPSDSQPVQHSQYDIGTQPGRKTLKNFIFIKNTSRQTSKNPLLDLIEDPNSEIGVSFFARGVSEKEFHLFKHKKADEKRISEFKRSQEKFKNCFSTFFRFLTVIPEDAMKINLKKFKGL